MGSRHLEEFSDRFFVEAHPECCATNCGIFFDNVIIEATVQFVGENQESVRRLHAGLKPAVAMRNSFSGITHLPREPLGPLLLGGSKVPLREETLSPRDIEMIGLLQRGVQKEAEAIENYSGQ